MRTLRLKPVRLCLSINKAYYCFNYLYQLILAKSSRFLNSDHTPTKYTIEKLESLAQEEAMKRSRFGEEQIIGILKQAEAGVKVQDPCRQNRILDATFYMATAGQRGRWTDWAAS